MTALPRRTFLRRALAAPSALIVGFDPDRRAWVLDQPVSSRPFEKLPRLDGRLLFDEATLDAAVLDNGNIVHRRPRAVLQPASVQDVISMVAYASRHGVPIAMRGQGHSVYGQTQAEAGIVIDSRSLGRVLKVDREFVDAQAGASWHDVNRATLEKGLTPAVMPDTMTLSVGGGASVGTWGHTSHRFGALVDTIRELDVVTGEGRLQTCSSEREPELFEMVLAGLGQCALIVRTRVRVVTAPRFVVRQHLLYDDLDAFYADQQRIVQDGRFDHLDARFIQDSKGTWRPRIETGSFVSSVEPDMSRLRSGLRFDRHAAVTRAGYWEYLHNQSFTPQPAAQAERDKMRASRRNPSIVMWLPFSAGRAFVEQVVSTPSGASGTWVLASPVMDTSRFTRPLFRMPAERLAISLWLFRSAPIEDRQGFRELLAAGRSLVDRMREVGGKRYPPYGLVTSQAEWAEHYGPAVWERLVRAKARFDPNNVLTPGPGIFSPPPSPTA